MGAVSQSPAPLVVPRRALTRTETILAVIRQQLLQRAALFDGATDLAQVQISVKLLVGTNEIRGIEVVDERVYRRDRRT